VSVSSETRPAPPPALALDTAPVAAFLDDAHARLAADVAAWARETLAPMPAPANDDEGRAQALEMLESLGAGGWLRALDGGDLRALVALREAVAWASPLADAVLALQALGSAPLATPGAEHLRDQWLPRVVDGSAMAGFAMTEPDAGSDVAAIATVARRDGEEYVLDGRKTLISNAGIADFYVVFATVDPRAGRRGITAFLVPADAPGLRFAGAQVLASPHPLGELAFEGCRVPASNRIGDEGAGFRVGMATLDRLRATVAAAACGMAARALDEALAHVRARHQFGKPLADFQLVQQKLARMATELAAARLLTWRAAWEADRGADRITLESAMAKAYATEAAQRVIDDAVQLLGGRGVLADSPVDRLYRSVRALRIYEGTTEVQHLVIASQLLRAAGAAEAEAERADPARDGRDGATPPASP